MQFHLFDAPVTPIAPLTVEVRPPVPAVPINSLKAYNPHAKKFYWDGARFGIMSMGAILWFQLHHGKRGTCWVANMRGEQPESYSEHLFCDAHDFPNTQETSSDNGRQQAK